jgi:hypothetical protein
MYFLTIERVRFASILKKTPLSKLSLHFDTFAITATEACAATGGVYSATPQGPDLHLDVSTLQRHVLYREVSTPQGHEPPLDMSTIQRSVLLLDVSTPQGPELHLDLSTLQRPVLHLERSTLQGHELQLDVLRLQSTPRLTKSGSW